MKILYVIPFLFLTGCVNLTFDALEFDRYLQIQETADVANLSCGTPSFTLTLSKLKADVDHQVAYSTLRGGGRPQVAAAGTDLKAIVDGLYSKYQSETTPSVEYCKLKTNNIAAGASLIVKELGKL